MKKNKVFYLITIIVILLIITVSYNHYDKLNSIIWAIASSLIIISGLFWSIKLKFIQLNFKEMFNIFKNKKNDTQNISTFESLSLSLGGRIGVGSLAGIALAIYIGGSGTIFWIWVITLIASVNTFVESLLGVIYQKKEKSNISIGGPSYYIKNGLGYKKLAIIYSILIIISYIIGFLTIQSNTIVHSVISIINIKPIIIVIVLTIITFIIIMNGTKKIANISAKIVPTMTLMYIVMGLIIIFSNITIIPNILLNIFKNAWTASGIKGGVLSVAIIGIQRGIFSNESGIGTSAIAAAMTNDSPLKQGWTQVLGVYITSLIICTITALIILTSNYTSLNINDLNGIEITQYAFKYHFGEVGSIFLCIIVILFAFSTIVSGYYYGETSLKFLFKNISNTSIIIFKIIVVTLISIGGIVKSSIIWNIVDIFVAGLIIINIISCLLLYRDVLLNKKR